MGPPAASSDPPGESSAGLRVYSASKFAVHSASATAGLKGAGSRQTRAAQDRTGEATSGRQKQPVYVTRVEVVRKQTLWNYQVRRRERRACGPLPSPAAASA